MFLSNVIISLLAVILGSTVIEAGEYCPNSFYYCSSYCCGYPSCCSDCSRSVYPQSNCYYRTYVSVAPIAGGVISSIIFIAVVVFLICLCCGCVCSHRTGIQRRGRIVQTGGSVTVVSQNQSQVAYPQAHIGYPQAPVAYPQAPVGYQQASTPYPPPYPQGVPPAYNAAYVHDAKY